MIAVDSAVAFAAFGAWHRMNDLACSVLDEEPVVLVRPIVRGAQASRRRARIE